MAQFSAQLYPAETVLKGRTEMFFNMGVYDDVNTVMGGLRSGIGGYTDGALRFGYADVDGDGDDWFILAGDARYQLMEMRIQDPIDLSVGGMVETLFGGHDDSFSLGGYVVGSRPVALTRSRNIWPYGRLALRWDDVGDNSDFNIGFNLGSSLELGENSRVSAELQFDDQFGFILGLCFGL